MAFDFGAALGGLMSEGGKQFIDAGKREQFLADKRLDEERENRKLEAQFAKQQALADHNYDRDRAGATADAERNHGWKVGDDVRNFDQQQSLAREGRAESFANAKEMHQMQRDDPGPAGKAYNDYIGMGYSEDDSRRLSAPKPETTMGDYGKTRRDIENDQSLTPEQKKVASAALLTKVTGADRGVTEAQRIQALDKIASIKKDSINGGIDDNNIAEINAMLRSIGEPPYKKVMVSPGKKKMFGEDVDPEYRFDQEEVKSTSNGSGNGLMGGGRSNNVGNMKVPGSDTEFQKFGSKDEAVDAVGKQLRIYGKRGINTIDKIVSTYSPDTENDTKSLIAEASRVTGFKPGQEIDMEDPAHRALVTAAILKQEGAGRIKQTAQPSATAAPTTASPQRASHSTAAQKANPARVPQDR